MVTPTSQPNCQLMKNWQQRRRSYIKLLGTVKVVQLLLMLKKYVKVVTMATIVCYTVCCSQATVYNEQCLDKAGQQRMHVSCCIDNIDFYNDSIGHLITNDVAAGVIHRPASKNIR